MSSKEIEAAVKTLLREQREFRCGELSARTGRSRQALHRHLSKWVAEGRLVRAGKGRGTRYRSRRSLAFERNYPLLGPAAEEVRTDVLASLAGSGVERTDAAEAVLGYVVAELVNNAALHSGARSVTVELIGEEERLLLAVADGGAGALANLARGLDLKDPLHALQELAKGRVTTRPEDHAGIGIFLASRMVDHFALNANGFEWIVDNELGDQAVREVPEREGTEVRVQLSTATTVTPEELVARHVESGAVDATRAVVRLFEHGAEFASRAEARRLVAGLEKFREVVLDFRGVQGVGRGFVDEVFEVFGKAHPDVRLVPRAMNAAVTFVVERGLPAPG